LIEDHINIRYQGRSPKSVAVREYIIKVCCNFVASGLADPDFEARLTSGNDSEFWSRLSEALIADCLGLENISTRSDTVIGGPDFLLVHKGKRIWIEVICPEPRDIPENWLHNSARSVDFPYEAIRLRWTAAIKEKSEKLIGKKSEQTGGYLNSDMVKPEDAYVIAINGCQLRSGPFSSLYSISQFPFAAEAVFPIGPIQATFNKETGNFIGHEHIHQPSVKNKNKSNVLTNLFLDSRYAPISAIWGVDLNGQSVIGVSQPMVVVHNPMANHPIPWGVLPADNHYSAELNLASNEWVVKKH